MLRSQSAPRPALLLVGLTVALALGALEGCATYAPEPLGVGHGTTDVTQLSVPATAMPTRTLASHRFNPSDGLDVTEVAMLAVANNPQLKVKRDDLGIARAQAFAAGLLPDPQLSAGVDFPSTTNNAATKAFNLGLSEDIGALLTRSSRMTAARHSSEQVNLDLLWAEWQTVARARLLFDQVQAARAREKLLRHEVSVLAPMQQRVDNALKAGNLTYAGAATGLNAVADVRQRLAEAMRQRIQSAHDLRDLLGLTPSAPLPLVGAPYLPEPASAQVQHALALLPDRRPDLLALKAGYAAQEASLRGAILAQFPAITLGFTHARDTGNVTTSGFSVGITLPLFNRNRGNIAIARATRQRLHDDYAARLFHARSDMLQLQTDLTSLRAQINALGAHVLQLNAARKAAQQAWQANLLDWPTYLALRSSALDADLQLASLRQQRAKQAIALETLLGGDWSTPDSTTSTLSSQGRQP